MIGTLGELKEMKGQRDLILAAAEVAKSIPEAYFVIAGKDNSLDRSFRRELRRLVKVFELETRFLWLDWIEDPSAFFSAIDVFVSPSHSESFGLAILEAMTHATPIVATQTDGARALLGRTYGLVPIQDPVLMAQGIKAVHDDPELAAAMALELEKKAVDRFSLGRMLDDVEKLYRRLNGE